MTALATMSPVICHGRSVWDRRALPPDELEERRLVLEDLVAGSGCAAFVGFDSGSQPGPAAWLTNHRSSGGLATIIVVPGAAPVLLAGLGGGRDHPFIKSTSFVEDVRWYPTTGEGVAAVLAEHELSGPIATAGAEDCLSSEALAALQQALGRHQLASLDAGFGALRRHKRQRELAVLRQAASAIEQGRSAVVARAAAGLDGALVAGEVALRLAGCRDVRVLASAADGSLRPWPWGGELAAPEQATVVLAGELLGYWSERAFLASGAETAPSALLDEAMAALRPGAGLAAVEEALGRSGVEAEVCGTGLELSEAPSLASGETVAEGDVLALRLWGREGGLTLASRCVVVREDGAVPLGESPSRRELLAGVLG